MFNLGPGEIVVLLLLALILLGPLKLPELAPRLRPRTAMPRPLLRRRSVRRWTLSDWLVVCAAIAAAGAAALLALAAPPR